MSFSRYSLKGGQITSSSLRLGIDNAIESKEKINFLNIHSNKSLRIFLNRKQIGPKSSYSKISDSYLQNIRYF